ncbi:MAG: hypothetical protein M3Y44_09950 [Actinomycetota bacterium]|nr:hypothetical protein [Actinomycetota bacterium]
MLRRLRFALSPGWLVLHLLAVALIVSMVLLGRWQLNVSDSKHFSLQNFGYALQWWAFSLFVLAMWARILLDTARRTDATGQTPVPRPEPGLRSDEPVAYRRYVMPQSGEVPAPAGDPQHAAYNDYLAGLDNNAPAASRASRAEGTTP